MWKEWKIPFTKVELGEAIIADDTSKEILENLKATLLLSGLELMDDKKSILIERIKNTVVEMIHYSDELISTNFSDYLSERLEHSYGYLATLFSEVTGSTIEHFIIAHKVERIKELLLYDELNLKEIAHKLHYSSESHLSNQFKKVTGLTPGYFKTLREFRQRIALEDV